MAQLGPVRGYWCALMKRAIAILGLVIIIAVTAMLGNWQMRRAGFKEQLERQRQAAMTNPPIDLNEQPDRLLAGDKLPIAALGTWIPAGTIFIDNRTLNGVAGFHVLTPLALANKESTLSGKKNPGPGTVLVLRGWIAADRLDRNRLPEVNHLPGLQQVRGIMERNLPQAMQLGADVQPGPEDRLWQYFDLDKYRRWSGQINHPFVIRQTSNADDGLIRQWPVPGNDVDRHHGYAFQWFAMSGAALLFLLWLIGRALWLARANR